VEKGGRRILSDTEVIISIFCPTWILFSFDANNAEENGNGIKYTPTTEKFYAININRKNIDSSLIPTEIQPNIYINDPNY
jgi:hypothetical protein